MTWPECGTRDPNTVRGEEEEGAISFPTTAGFFTPHPTLLSSQKKPAPIRARKNVHGAGGVEICRSFQTVSFLDSPFFLFFFFFIVVLDARGKVQDSSSRQSFDGIGNVGRKILRFLSSLNERD